MFTFLWSTYLYQAVTTRHEFEVLRLWETEPSLLMESIGTMPFAVLAGTTAKEDVLREVASRIEQVSNQKNKAGDYSGELCTGRSGDER